MTPPPTLPPLTLARRDVVGAAGSLRTEDALPVSHASSRAAAAAAAAAAEALSGAEASLEAARGTIGVADRHRSCRDRSALLSHRQQGP